MFDQTAQAVPSVTDETPDIAIEELDELSGAVKLSSMSSVACPYSSVSSILPD